MVDIKQTLLQVMSEYAGQPGYFQTGPILSEVKKRLNLRGEAQEQALLTLWGDMFRTGVVAAGYNLNNPDLPFCHLTERGRSSLKSLSRDPANPDGYLAALRSIGTLPPIADGYIEEALTTYNCACFRAAAVMTGAASETLVLDLRDGIVSRLGALGRTPAAQLGDWRAKTILDAIAVELTLHVRAMPAKLREAFQYTWPAFLQQIRAGRNDAGHPSSVSPISGESVHASLLTFPELFKLSIDLQSWISTSMP